METDNLTDDCTTMCDTFAQILLEEINEIQPLVSMDIYDSGLGGSIPFEEDKGKEETAHHEIDINCPSSAKPTCYNERLQTVFCGDEEGDSLLHISILQDDESLVLRIIQMAPDFTYLCAANDLGQTALHLAVLTRRSRIVRRLVCAGAAVATQDKSGNSPLHLACMLGYYDIAQHLLKPVEYKETLFNDYKIPYQGIPLNVLNLRNFDGSTCLHLAIENSHVQIVRLLLGQGIDGGLYVGHGKSGRTALHLAADAGNAEMLQLFIESTHCDSVDVTDFDGKTPFQLAFGRGHVEAQRMLIQNGAEFRNLNFEEEDFGMDISLQNT